MRGLGTVLKSLDRSNNTVLFNYSFPYLEGFCQQVLAPLQFLSHCAFAGILCHMAFYAEGLLVCTSGSPLPRRLEKGYLDIEKHKISR